jgi:hypothetical protein
VFFVLQRNLIHQPYGPDGRGINISGVDFWHAVEFSRNGSFLRGRFTGPSGLSLRVLQLSRPDFSFPPPSGGGCRPAFAFRRFRLYQTLSALIPCQRALSFRLLGRSDE